MKHVNQKVSIPVTFSHAFKIIAEFGRTKATQKHIAPVIGLGMGDVANRKKRGTLAQYIIDWGSERGIAAEDLFPELRRLEDTPEISAGGGVAFYPPMMDGGRQDWIACGPSWLAAMGSDQENLRIFPLKEQRMFRPGYGLMPGQWLIFDISVNQAAGQGVYLIRLEDDGPLLVRVLIPSLGGVEIEGALEDLENQPLPGTARIVGRCAGLGALL
jgi:hypothetical protein